MSCSEPHWPTGWYVVCIYLLHNIANYVFMVFNIYMKIPAIYTYNIPKFKGGDDNVIAYDDEISQERRKFIRENYEYENMPYQRIYEKEPCLEEYQLQKLLNFYVNKPKKIDGDIMSELPLSNLRNISASSRYTPNIYRGSTLYDSPDWVLKKLKEAGVKTVINLGDYGESYKKKIEKAGFEYVDFDISHMRYSYIDDKQKKDKLIKFIKAMQKEYVYMGCECGTYKTDAGVYFNNLFNPKVKGYCKIYSPEMVSEVPQIADEIYLNMTDEDKKSIGWTPEFEHKFNERIAKLLDL